MFRETRFSRCNFNPRSPHGERPVPCIRLDHLTKISIHAPRTGSDEKRKAASAGANRHFNPRSPHGERPVEDRKFTIAEHFNPRSPHGERHGCLYCKVPAKWLFQSTLPARGATCTVHYKRSSVQHFNPRSPHGERQFILRPGVSRWIFQSTLPARGATV